MIYSKNDLVTKWIDRNEIIFVFNYFANSISKVVSENFIGCLPSTHLLAFLELLKCCLWPKTVDLLKRVNFEKIASKHFVIDVIRNY